MTDLLVSDDERVWAETAADAVLIVHEVLPDDARPVDLGDDEYGWDA